MKRSRVKRFLRREWTRIFEENGIYQIPDSNLILSSNPGEFSRLMYGKANIIKPDDSELSDKEL